MPATDTNDAREAGEKVKMPKLNIEILAYY
jgi:hypothetical protein